MQIAIYMDHPSSLNYSTDSTFILGLELQRRGYDLVFLDSSSISWCEHGVELQGRHISFNQNYPFYNLGQSKKLNLSDMGMIMIRKDPPFDMAYVTMTYFLERFKPQVLIVNDPRAIRDFNDKILSLDLYYLMPPTLITNSMELAYDFCQEHKDCVIKVLYSSRSRQSFYIREKDSNFFSIWQTLLTDNKNTPLVIQKFLPQIYEGDKRVLIADGKILHTFARVPAKQDFRTSLSCGASVFKTDLTKRDQEVAEEVALAMQKNNIFWAGIDIIDGQLIEINITSPTGLRNVNELYQIKSESVLVDAMEKQANLS